MKIYIVIPAHNEQGFIGDMLASVVNQTLLPSKVVVVNDDSTDDTSQVVSKYTSNYNWISTLNITSTKEHIPGSKIVDAFYKGLETLDNGYDIICKFDADIILPNNYLECIAQAFKYDNQVGIAGGLAYIKKNDKWVYETVSSKEHVRGPFKAYRKACFEDIGGLKNSIAWDTVDALLAQYYSWKVITVKNLHVKHLKPTGNVYTQSSKYSFGEGLYKMRYSIALTLIASLKSAINKKSISYFTNTIKGYLKAKKSNLQFLVTEEQGKFIRKLRWKGIFRKIF